MTLRHAIAAITSATLLLPTIGAAEAKKIKRDGNQIVSERYDLFERRDDDFPAMRFRQDRSPDVRLVAAPRAVWTPRIDQRIERQTRRIRRGMRTGRLNRWESMRLRGWMYAIRSSRQFSRLDGHVSRRERRELMRMLDQNSQRIRRLVNEDRKPRFRDRWF